MKAFFRFATCLALCMAVTCIAQSIQLNIGPNGQACGRITTRNYCTLPAVVLDSHGNVLRNTTVVLDAMKEQNLAGQIVGGGYITIDGVEYTITTPWSAYMGTAPTTLSYDFLSADGAHGGHIDIPDATHYSRGGGGKGGGGAGWQWTALTTANMTEF